MWWISCYWPYILLFLTVTNPVLCLLKCERTLPVWHSLLKLPSWSLWMNVSNLNEKVCIVTDAHPSCPCHIAGHGFLINYPRQTVLHQINFKAKVKSIKFSPNGKYVAITHGNHIQVWKAPGFTREFAPFVLHRTYTGHHDDVLQISWSPDSK